MSTGSQAEDRTCLLDAGALVIRAPRVFQASVLTIVWNNGPGHGRRIDAPGHPENAQPTEMLPSLLPRQELREIGENNGQRSTDTAERERKKKRARMRESSHTIQTVTAKTKLPRPRRRLSGETTK